MPKKIKWIEELTDYELSWLLLNIILRSHDPAGVSLGRSLRNVILAEIIHLLEAPDLEVDDYEGKKENLLVESTLRVKHYDQVLLPQQMLLLSDRVQYLDNSILAEVLLVQLMKWYQKDAEINRFSMIVEMKYLHPALILLNLNPGIYLEPWIYELDTQIVVNESRERWHRLWQDEHDAAYWNKLR